MASPTTGQGLTGLCSAEVCRPCQVFQEDVGKASDVPRGKSRKACLTVRGTSAQQPWLLPHQPEQPLGAHTSQPRMTWADQIRKFDGVSLTGFEEMYMEASLTCKAGDNKGEGS